MGFQRGVLHPLGGERSLIADRGASEGCGDIAEFAVASATMLRAALTTRCSAVLS